MPFIQLQEHLSGFLFLSAAERMFERLRIMNKENYAAQQHNNAKRSSSACLHARLLLYCIKYCV